MAIKTLAFISLILRPYVKQSISDDGWKFLLSYADPYRNFDGELMAFGTMSVTDMDDIIDALVSFGYVGPNKGDSSDMVLSDSFTGTSDMPDWIEVVNVQFFSEASKSVQAWKMKGSGSYDLIDFHSELKCPRKGYDCDWHPLIGKIGEANRSG